MATFTEIKTVRLTINDPSGFIDIQEVSSVPSPAANQTAYKLTTSGAYVDGDSVVLDLYISDLRLGALIDAYGVAQAICQSYKIISGKLGSELRLKKNQTGAEVSEYTALQDLYYYYKDLYAVCSNDYQKASGNTTGRYKRFKAPEVAGGNV